MPRIDEAVRRTVARAIETGDLLDVAAEAGRLAAAFPGIAGSRIADLLFQAGVEARINLVLGPEHGGAASAGAICRAGRPAAVAGLPAQ